MRTSPMNDGLLGPKLALGQPTPMNYRGMTAGASPQLFSPRRHPCFTLGRSAAGGGETSPIQAANGGSTDAFVVKLNAAGSALVYSTYLGGSNLDEGHGIAVDTAGNAYVTGS